MLCCVCEWRLRVGHQSGLGCERISCQENSCSLSRYSRAVSQLRVSVLQRLGPPSAQALKEEPKPTFPLLEWMLSFLVCITAPFS